MTGKFKYTFALLLLSSALTYSQTANKNQNSAGSSLPVSVDIFPPQDEHVHSSSIVECPNGDFLCCWFQGSGERTSNDVRVMGARLRKGEKKWSTPWIMADTPGNPDCNPLLFFDGTGRLHLVWIVVVANRWEQSILKTRNSVDYTKDGPPKWEWQDIILLKPGDEFAEGVKKGFSELKTPDLAWGGYAPKYEKMVSEAALDPVKRETGWMTRIKPLRLPEGRILLPLYSDGFNLSLVAISDDNGDTWKPSLPLVGRGNVQPAIVRKKNGTLVALMRDNGDSPGRIMRSESADNGFTWSTCTKTSVPNPGSSVDAIALASGKWLLVCNDLEDGRFRLAVSLSDDEGATWKWTRYIECDSTKGNSYAYPTVIQASDGMIHLTYSRHLREGKTICHSVFPESWITGK